MVATKAKPRINVKPNKLNGFESPADFFGAVANAAAGSIDRRLQPRQTAGSDEHSTISDPYGGFLVPEAWRTDGLLNTLERDPTAGRTTDFQMNSPIERVPARMDEDHSATGGSVGGLTATRRTETQEITSSRMEMASLRFDAKPLLTIAFATEELVQSSTPMIAAVLEAGFRDAAGDRLLNEKIHGHTAGFSGVLDSAATITVAKESMQSADTINATNVKKMRSRCWDYGRAIWLANQECYDQLAGLQIEGSSSGSVPLYHHSQDEDKPDTLAGRPIFFTEHCKPLGDFGDLICGVWSEYLIGTLRIGSTDSMYVRFERHERCFKFFWEADGKPWWLSAVTPRNGANTLSPFVTLAERA